MYFGDDGWIKTHISLQNINIHWCCRSYYYSLAATGVVSLMGRDFSLVSCGGGGSAKEVRYFIFSLLGRKYGVLGLASLVIPCIGTLSTICFRSMSWSLPNSFCFTVSNARSKFSICMRATKIS